MQHLIRPHASDSNNIGIQLRSTAEWGAARRQIATEKQLDYVILDTTLSLPLVSRKDLSLFFEHVKRLCCVEALARGTCCIAISKSHGLPAIEVIEALARRKLQLPEGRVAEHWFLRIPSDDDEWNLDPARSRNVPPVGAVTYLVRFHRTTPVLRVDVDVKYWRQELTTAEAEIALFEDLDYISHDQRAYGYPYPLKAGHNRASLTRDERVSLRRQIIDAAVAAGLKRSLFRDPSIATGHA